METRKADPRYRRGFGAIRKLPSGRFQASYVGPDQDRHLADDTFAAKADAEGWLASERRLVDLDEWEPPEERKERQAREEFAAALTVQSFASSWLQESAEHGRLRPLTVLDYERILDRYILPTLGETKLPDVTRNRVSTWHDVTLSSAPARSRSKAYSLLRAIMNAAVREGFIPSSPVQIRGAGAARRKHEIEPASLGELDAIVSAMPDRLKLAVLLATWCAMRYGEIAALRRKDVSRDATEVRIARSVSFLPGGAQVGPPKTKAGLRRVAVPPHVAPLIQQHLTTHVAPGADSLLFPGAKGGYLHESVLYRHWDRARREAGRPDLRFHDLRHTGATLAAQAGATTAELQARLGHATPDAAMVYQHAARLRDKQLAENLSRLAAEFA